MISLFFFYRVTSVTMTLSIRCARGWTVSSTQLPMECLAQNRLGCLSTSSNARHHPANKFYLIIEHDPPSTPTVPC